ncbi:farnesol dehydrogenase-like [Musca vetustissima]|uniref:farnesol dehydrogenase-like n=1 Tax=Musca vetustissima TaxID=27455 RepID=UPI002AB6FD5E|nr:farnesol dehydrogenase-like [Musca vetustissima]
MERWQNKVAVVTGASSGIGAAAARDLVAAGVKVVALARRKNRVEEIIASLPTEQQSLLTAIECDVSKLESVNKAFDEIIAKFGGIDILINNAGCTLDGQLVAMDPVQLQNILQTNVMGIIYCTQRAFKSMKERNVDGHVVLINSILGHKVPGSFGQVPTSNIYAPSKHAVTALTEMYRQEFSGLGTKVKITSISPGAVNTEIITDKTRKILGECFLDAHDISNAILYTLSTPPHVQIHEMTIKPVGELF